MKTLFLALALLFSLNAYAAAQGDIGSVDFKNFTYDAFCLSSVPEKITVKAGEFYEEKQEDGYVDRFYFKIFEVSYGDLTGDGKDEAVILSVCNTGGTGNFSEGFIYTMKAGKPVLAGRIPGGDRAYGGLRTARVDNGTLIVESNEPGELGGSCCPEIIITTIYKLTGNNLTVVGKPARRDLIPKDRVSFDKGTSGKTFTVKIPAGESHRFIVGARAGQTLMVSVDRDRALLRMIGDVDVVEGINNFTAKLPRGGDHTFEVQNDSAEDMEITVNVKIL